MCRIRLDSVITHKIIGIPIFAAIIFLVFYISQTTLGTWIADWLVAWIETFQGWGRFHDGNMRIRCCMPFLLMVS